MRLPIVFLLWPLALLCSSGALANQDSGKYELILYWRLRQFTIDGLGQGTNIVAPKCGGKCTFEDFIKAVTQTNKGARLKDANGNNIKDAQGRIQYERIPDYTKMDFTPFETDALFSDPQAAAREIDKVGFTGQFMTDSLFGVDMTFDKVIAKVEAVIDDTKEAFAKDGRDLKKTYLKEMTDLLPIIANGRRKAGAAKIRLSFTKWAANKANLENLQIVMKDPISRPPFVYEQIDFDATYRANSQRVGIQAWEAAIKDYATVFNSKGQGLSHAKAIRSIEDLHKKLENDCK
ncbi:hypothetical protein BBK36DRAFT_1161698 [Trichoderma citrinoviride]|uniref:Uncharacterized protein n=1 Tax=Trichoderma citrinoviride TaxID=58853 RepID=A0A2T4B343_9HYPO|nr:hypothetical protein BBK36DRAFT_1161698 [Trichoderma citrinoviride]PTB63752.1 hypothetical protein BBK36DRAFT_1161698 [Trichoderma citrinoviride]